MSGFSAEWLARREPHDRRARNAAVLAAVSRCFAGEASMTIVDLACGSGASLRAISHALPPRQNWRLVDNDLSLLARAPTVAGAATTIRAIPVDLVHDLEAVLDGPVDLVTTSAFLDLVSQEWLERLVTEIAARSLPFYAALSYDGRIAFDPADGTDAAIAAAFNRHQRTDKGFGPALGPDAATAAIALFDRLGYLAVRGSADWELEPADDIQAELLGGIAGAARELGCPAADVDGWLARRRHLFAAQRSFLQIGHLDFFARPSGRR